MGYAYDTWGNSWLATWGGSWGSGAAPVVALTKGGIDEKSYRKYRKHLERLAEISLKRERSKYVNEVIEIAGEIDDLALETPEISALAAPPETSGTLKLRTINYDKLSQDIEILRKYLDNTIHYRRKILEMEREAEDELAFLLML